MNARTVSVVLAALLAACSGSDQPAPSETAPTAPAQNDPAYNISQVGGWYIIGNAHTPGEDALAMTIVAPNDVDFVDAWVGGQAGVRLDQRGTTFSTTVDISELEAGEHEILLAADGADTAFARVTFMRSHPLYAIVSTDWDDADNSDLALELQQTLHDEHPELILTHFVGPYTYTDPTLEADRRTLLTNWVIGMRDTYGDEIGLHIHPYCNFVDTTEVECRIQPSTVYANGDNTGYTIMCSAYTEEEFKTLLDAADALFVENGLGKPTSFRAGGWTADLSTLRALASAGYVADTSANNWARMEEWQGVQNGVLYEWNSENWATIGDTSQPYYPSDSDLLMPGTPAVPILEVPDNGILVDYVTRGEMVEIFEANWDGSALAEPVAYSIGYHPTNFNETYKARIGGTLTHIEQFLASNDAGPVIYARLSDMALVWPVPE